MRKAGKFGPEGAWTAPEGARERRSADRRGVGKRAPQRQASPPAGRSAGPLPCFCRPAGSARRSASPPAGGSAPERPASLRNAVAEEAREPAAAPHTEAPQPSDPDASPALRAPRLSGRLAALAETAKAYARSAQADNTRRAYAADWKMFASWLRRQGLSETPPDPEAVGLYLAAQVERGGAELSVATLERRLSGIAWRYRQLGQPLDIRDRHIATVLAGIRRRHGRPPLQKAADLRRRTSGDAGDAGHGPAGPARPGDPGDRLRRRPAPLRDRRARLWAGRDRGRLRLGRNLPRGRPAHHPRQDRLARGRDRPRLARRTPARSPCSRPGCGSGGSPAGPCSGPSRARTAASDPSA